MLGRVLAARAATRRLAEPLARRGRAAGAVATLTVGITAGLATGCTSGLIEPALTEAEYRSEMSTICARTRDAFAALPAPPELISTVDFGREVARLLGVEAEAARNVLAPAEFDDDHRAFVLNTDEQVIAWTTLADIVATAPDDTDGLIDVRTDIAELTLGRTDLANSMNLTACAAPAPAG